MQNFLKALGIAVAATLPCVAAQAACEDYTKELRTMVSADQALRSRLDFSKINTPDQQKIGAHMAVIDRANTARLKVLFAQCGFPDAEKHGERAERDAWLLVQHADHDRAFQKQTLALLEKIAAERGEPVGRNFAYLSDRVAVAERRPQLYGTQLMSLPEKPCDFDFDPLDDRQKVEARRAALGMPPLDIYKEMVIKNANCQGAQQERKPASPSPQ